MKKIARHCTSKAAIYLGLGVCAATALPAFAQMAGVSHPEQAPITTSPDAIAPAVSNESYVPGSKPSAAIKTQPEEIYYAPYTGPAGAASTAAAPAQNGNGIQAVRLGNAAYPASTGYSPAPYSTARAYTEPQLRGTPVAAMNSAAGDPDAGIVTTWEGPANQLPIGTVVKVNLGRDLSTVTTASGSTFTAEIVEPVKREGRVLLPAGSILSGRVTDVHGGRRISGAASIHLEAVSVTLPDGTLYPMRGQVIDTDDRHAVKVDSEGSLVRRGHPKETAAIFALTTGSGLAAGAVAGGPAGALIGAGIGAGVSTVVWLKQDRQASIPAGTRLVFSLSQPLTVGVE